MHRRLKDFSSAIEDLVKAVELSEDEKVTGQTEAKVKEDQDEPVQEEGRIQLALAYNDFAVQCFSRGFYTDATLLLNKAINEETGLAGLYLNRGGETVAALQLMSTTRVCSCLFGSSQVYVGENLFPHSVSGSSFLLITDQL